MLTVVMLSVTIYLLLCLNVMMLRGTKFPKDQTLVHQMHIQNIELYISFGGSSLVLEGPARAQKLPIARKGIKLAL
jgi:hypothetical protein